MQRDGGEVATREGARSCDEQQPHAIDRQEQPCYSAFRPQPSSIDPLPPSLFLSYFSSSEIGPLLQLCLASAFHPNHL